MVNIHIEYIKKKTKKKYGKILDFLQLPFDQNDINPS